MELPDSWHAILGAELCKPYFLELNQFLTAECNAYQVFPPEHQVFHAFEQTSYEAVKVVILGQDPYHGPGQAHGLAFSVEPGVKPPPSLVNIFKELQADVELPIPKSGCLIPWAKQGVLLLNTTLTVRAGQAHSHRNQGWELFSDAVLAKLQQRQQPLIFVLWGGPAQKKKTLLDGQRHAILEAAHPSPLSAYRGFFGSKPFSRINRILASWVQEEIDWRIAD
jgi:uracil-DNA glycosylase